jgi:hypothetical protein
MMLFYTTRQGEGADKCRLAELLKQLFFKQNKYADNNAKYVEKKPTPEPQANDVSLSRSQTIDFATSSEISPNIAPDIPRTTATV